MILMWLYGSSDEGNLEEFIGSNRSEMERLNGLLAAGGISNAEHARLLGEHEERLNNLRGDIELRRDKYNSFCDEVVARLPQNRTSS